jgi:hypothetical protein
MGLAEERLFRQRALANRYRVDIDQKFERARDSSGALSVSSETVGWASGPLNPA